MSCDLKDIVFDLFGDYEDVDDIINVLRSLESNKEITKDEYDEIMDNYDDLYQEYESRKKKYYILKELDKFDLINPTDKNIKIYYSTITGIDCNDILQEEIKEIEHRLLDYVKKGIGTKSQCKDYIKRLEWLKKYDNSECDTMTVQQKKEYLTEHIMNDMLYADEITQEDYDDFYNNYDKYIEEYIQYTQRENVLRDYDIVDLLVEFRDLKNIDKIDKFFEKSGWKLLRTKDDDYYQLYFGKNVKVDNMREYGFPYLLDKENTKIALESFIDYRIELESNSTKNNKEMEVDI